MARYFDVHPANPQPRSLAQVAAILEDGGLVAYPTDSGFALGCRLGTRDALDRIRTIRGLNDRHHFTLVCSEFAQLGAYVQMGNREFRAIKASTPGPYTFILPATREAPKAMLHPKKKTVGVRITDHVTARALLDVLGVPPQWRRDRGAAVRSRRPVTLRGVRKRRMSLSGRDVVEPYVQLHASTVRASL